MAAQTSTRFPAPFGKYLLTQLLAVGGMAEVYRAKIFGASGFEKEMVVKRILPRYARNPNFVQMLIDEAKIAVSLSHGNIVPIYELGDYEGSYYIAMEYVEGCTILDILRDAHAKKHPLPWAHCLGVAAEVAKGLAYAHARTDAQGMSLGLVHRDINPRNIVVTPAGEVKILDFGIARASTKRHQTASGVIKGTPGYMSPEQMYGETVDARSDIYCLGILTFELLTLRRLFPVWDVAEMRTVFEAGPIPRPSELVPHVDPMVDGVVMKALARDLHQRFQTAAQFEEALRTLVAHSGTPITSFGLARELEALDAAPGPRAPRTDPRAALHASENTGDTDAARGEDGSAGHPQPQAASQGPRPPVARLATATTVEQSASARAAVVASPGGAARSLAVDPVTRPIETKPDEAAAFKMALSDTTDPRTPAPLPQVPTDVLERGQRTQVLAQNAAIAWAGAIGDDAEMLALQRATGTGPGALRRAVLMAAAATLTALVLTGVLAGEDIGRAVRRAVSGQRAERGVIIVKTMPSGAEVLLDGERKGRSNLKLQGVDISEPHVLEVRQNDQPPVVITLQRTDFALGDSGLPTYVFGPGGTSSAP